MYTFLNKNSVIHNFQFGFRQQYSISHALINITENIRKALDDGNVGCTKSFLYCRPADAVSKLNYCGILGISNDWFKSYISNRNQYISINGYQSGLATINCGIPRGSALGPLLFLLYINDLNQVTKFCQVHHFADNTNHLFLSNSIKKLNKPV